MKRKNTHLRSRLVCAFILLLFLNGIGRVYAQFPLPYCAPKFSAANAEPITLVDFAGVHRVSSAALAGAAVLEDFLGDTASVIMGQSYTITLEGNTDGQLNSFKVYVDWNQNNLFSDTAGEMFYIGTITNSTGTDGKQTSASILVPLYAKPGHTRLRVVKKYGGANQSDTACPSSGWGQVEDYTLRVAAPFSCLSPTNLAVTAMTSTTVSFSWSAIPGSAGYEYVVDQSATAPAGAGTSVAVTNATGTITTSGNWYIHVRTDCGSGNFSGWETIPATFEFPLPYCGAVLSGQAITSVVFAGINRTSSAANGAALENFLTDTGRIIPGLPYIITLKGNSGVGVDGYRVWIDWNQDNQFNNSDERYDAGEIVYSNGTDAISTSDTIIAPLNAQLGTTRMRIVKKAGGNGPFSNTSPCPTSGTGQAEDYTILVMKSPVCLTPIGLKITSISGTSVAFTWNAMHGVNGYEYVVNTTRSAPVAAGTATVTTNGNNASLTANTLYYVHVRSDCGSGDFSSWALDSFVTCTPPSGLTVNNLTHFSAELSWNAISGIANYEYVIDQNAASPTGPGTVTTNTSVKDSSFANDQAYYLHVRTHCGGGTYSAWTTQSFRTKLAFCSITVVSSFNILPTSATLFLRTLSATPKGYYYVLDQLPTDPTVAGTFTVDTIYNATNLQPSTKYYMHARTDCYGGLFSAWRTHEFTTLSPCYIMPGGLAASNITATGAMLRWDKISGAVGYEYVIDQVATDPATGGTPTTDTFVNKTGLTGGAVYYLHVRTDCGSGDYSDWSTFKFAACAGPLNLNATNITETEATVSWDSVSGAKEYEYLIDQLSISPLPGTTPLVTANLSEVIPNLTGGTQYYLHVRTNCDKGNYSVWEIYPFTTQQPGNVAGVAKPGNVSVIHYYPNPVTGILNYSINGTIGKGEVIRVTDITGRTVLSADVMAARGAIDMSSLAGGIYLVRYVTLTGSGITKITKQ